jgi:hypothetical protein
LLLGTLQTKNRESLRLRLLLGDEGAADGHDRGDDAVDPLRLDPWLAPPRGRMAAPVAIGEFW